MSLYNSDGNVRVTEADGNSRGLYAPDGSWFVNIDSGNKGLYGPNGCLNANTWDGSATMYNPDGGLWISNGILLYFGSMQGLSLYDEDVQAFFDRLPNPPADEIKDPTNALVLSAKEDGWWSKTDALHILAYDDVDNYKINLRQDAYHITAFNNPTFTQYRGVTGNGTSSYLGSGFNPTTAVSANFQRDNANFAIWSLTSGTGVVSDAGYYGGTDGVTIQCRDGSDNFTGRINQANVASSSGNTSGTGFYEVDRSGPNTHVSRKNGVVVSTNTTTTPSTALLNAELQYLRYGTSSYSTRQLSVGVIGGHLTNQESLDRYNAILTFLQAVGAVA